MSNLQVIEELCGICGELAKIVTEQQKILVQHEELALAEDIARVRSRFDALIGYDEWPDDTPDAGE